MLDIPRSTPHLTKNNNVSQARCRRHSKFTSGTVTASDKSHSSFPTIEILQINLLFKQKVKNKM